MVVLTLTATITLTSVMPRLPHAASRALVTATAGGLIMSVMPGFPRLAGRAVPPAPGVRRRVRRRAALPLRGRLAAELPLPLVQRHVGHHHGDPRARVRHERSHLLLLDVVYQAILAPESFRREKRLGPRCVKAECPLYKYARGVALEFGVLLLILCYVATYALHDVARLLGRPPKQPPPPPPLDASLLRVHGEAAGAAGGPDR